MTNYPEGLDELADKVFFQSKYLPQPADFARALLDALAANGFVLVDAKKQEPVACKTCGGAGGWEASASSTDYFWKNCPDCGHPAIPGRVALPEGQEPYGYMVPIYEEYPHIFMRHPLPVGYSPVLASETLYPHPAIPQAPNEDKRDAAYVPI